jgi:hypothetical protein
VLSFHLLLEQLSLDQTLSRLRPLKYNQFPQLLNPFHLSNNCSFTIQPSPIPHPIPLCSLSTTTLIHPLKIPQPRTNTTTNHAIATHPPSQTNFFPRIFFPFSRPRGPLFAQFPFAQFSIAQFPFAQFSIAQFPFAQFSIHNGASR